MNTPLRCLIVEDVEDDALLLLRRLRADGYDVTWERVDTPEAMRAALERQPWDIVLSDYQMPRFNGLAALKLLQASGLDVPFIIVSGTIGEATAVAMMKAGADYYLMKDALASLGVAVERELRNATQRRERQRAEAELARLHQQNELILGSTAEGILGVDLEGRHTFVNPAAARMLGYDAAELLGRHSHSIWHHTRPDGSPYPQEECQIYAACRDGTVHRTADEVFWRKDGTSFPVEYASTPTADQGRLVGAVVTFEDITERKRAEEVLTFLASTSTGRPDEPFFNTLARYLAQSLGMDFICIDRLEGDGLTAQTVAVWCDGKFEDNVAYALKDTPCGEVVGKTVCCFPASVCQFFPRDTVLKDLRAESYVGVTLWSHSGQPIGLIAVIGRRPLVKRPQAEALLKLVAVRAAGELERQDAEAELRGSEERFRLLFERASDGIALLTADGRVASANQAFTRMHGYSGDEMVGMNVKNLNPPAIVEKVPQRIAQVLGGEILTFETEHFHKDGHFVPMEISSSCMTLGGVTYLQAFHRDITERKKAEAALWESEERNRLLIDTSPDGIVLHQAGCIVFANPAAIKLLGAEKPADLIGKPAIEFVHPDFRSLAAARMQQAAGAGQMLPPVAEKLLRLDGTSIDVEITGGPLVLRGLPTVQLIVRDITERKQAAAKLLAQLNELNRWHGAMAGREGRVIEVKAEVNALLSRLGEPPRYPSANEGSKT